MGQKRSLVLPLVGVLLIAGLAAGALAGRLGGGRSGEGGDGSRRSAVVRASTPEVGRVLPDFELATLDGRRVRADDLLGKPAFINFWATWCPPCRAEMPDIQAIYDERGRDINILAINEDEPESLVRSFIDEMKLSLPVALDVGGEVHGGWNFNTLPTSIITDKDGRICFIAPGMISRSMMDEALAKARRGC